MLNYNHLRYFRAVAQDSNLTKAAQRLHLSQSALSVQIRKLELQLGHPLFERQGKRLVLTEVGRIALDYAETIFSTGEELLDTLRGQGSDSRLILRVGAISVLSRNFQLGLFRPLMGRNDVELVIRSGSMRELLAQLEAQTLDIVLSNMPVPRDVQTTWRSILLDEQAVSLVGRPARGQKRLRFPQDLRTIPVVLPSLGSSIRLAFDGIMEQAGIRPIVLAEVDDMAMLRLLARESDAVTLVPAVVVQDELESGTLVERARLRDVRESFYATVATRRYPNPLLREILPQFK